MEFEERIVNTEDDEIVFFHIKMMNVSCQAKLSDVVGLNIFLRKGLRG